MEWKEYKLGDVSEVITKGTTPSSIGASFTESGVKYIRSEMLGASKYISDNGFLYISDDTHKRLKRSQLKKDDILFSMAGAYLGKTAILREKDVPSNTNQAVALIRINQKLCDVDYVYYSLNLPATVAFINASCAQSAQPNINLKQIGDLSIYAPTDISDQRRIASILSSLDSKIETNNKINAMLEEMAQALFKSWFVDFEPFKDGEFVDSELGMIPKGWKVGKLGDIAGVTKASVNPGKTPEKLFSHYSLPAFDESKMPAMQYGSEIMSNKLVFGDKTTLLSKLNPHIKRVWFVNEVKDNPICSTEFIPIKANDETLCAFVHCCINSDHYYNKAVSAVNGATTSHQRIHPDDVMNMEIAYNDVVAKQFSIAVYPMLEKIANNITESSRLSSLRDTLLPKLMSGEIEI